MNLGVNVTVRAHHVHGVTVDELLRCECTEAVHELLFVQQEALQPLTEAAAVCHTALIQFIQLPDHCAQEMSHTKALFLNFQHCTHTHTHNIMRHKTALGGFPCWRP